MYLIILFLLEYESLFDIDFIPVQGQNDEGDKKRLFTSEGKTCFYVQYKLFW